MKIIITENHRDRLIEVMTKYFNDNFIPGGGWGNKKGIKKDVEAHDEYFFHFDADAEGSGDDAHMWYSVCDNHNLSEPLEPGTCPILTINSAKYDTLDGYFGPRWKELFRRWFEENTGLPLVRIERQNW